MLRDERESLAAKAIAGSRADQTEIVIESRDAALARFARGHVHQHVRERDAVANVRAIVGGRAGVVSTNDVSAASLRTALARATEIARLAPADPHRLRLPEAAEVVGTADAYVDATAKATAEARAAVCEAILAGTDRANAWCAGYVSNSAIGITVLNSNGVASSFDRTQAAVNVKALAADSTGFAEAYDRDIRNIDGGDVAEKALRKAQTSAAPRAVETGDWTVILEPPAFGELLSYLVPHFSAQSFDEKSSFCSGRGFDRAYFGDNVNLSDDYADELAPGVPFDYEGQPKQRLTLVEFGVVRNVVTDSYWASRLGRANTGHALLAPNPKGPQPYNIVVGAGSATQSELIASTQRGLLVSRFWYTRVVDQRKAMVTGMTRDGTYLIENGKIVGGVRNLRFNQSIVEALKNCSFSRERIWRVGPYHSMVLPTAKIENFRFTNLAEY